MHGALIGGATQPIVPSGEAHAVHDGRVGATANLEKLLSAFRVPNAD